MTREEILKRLQTPQFTVQELNEVDAPSQPGLYAFHLVDGGQLPLPSETLRGPKLLYVGKAESSLKSRDYKTHLEEGKSGSSTLRRSFGAILRAKLELYPVPREAPGKTVKATAYKFTSKSEKKLSQWMKKNLAVTFVPLEGGAEVVRDLEAAAIRTLKPPLCLQGCQHNFLAEIKALRSQCAEILREAPEKRA